MMLMSETETPLEKMTPYQRWELPSFDGSGPSNKKAIGDALPTAALLEQIQQQAHAEGYQAGYAEGRLRVQGEAERLSALMMGLEQQLGSVDQQVLQELLALALEVARQMVRQSLLVKPELVLNVVREAINSLPHFSHAAHLALHPDDAVLVRAAMGEQLTHSGWKVFEDLTVERGGCRVETAHSQIDATLAKRWQHVVTSLGQDLPWVDA